MNTIAVQCIFPQGQTTPERILSNPWHDRGFCEQNQYKAAIDRCRGGYEGCDLFISIFSERMKIERDYASDLEKWAASSLKDLSQSKEFGSHKKTWIDCIRASKEISNTHNGIAQRLEENVIEKMKAYKKEQYGKSILHVKKIKEFEHDFEQLQKNFTKILDRINKTKKEYQDAHRQLRKAEMAEKIIQSDNGAEEDQKSRVKMSVGTYKKECDACKSKYQQAVQEMLNARPSYEKSMKEVLDRTHEFERKRLTHFKQLFQALQQACLVDNDPHLKNMNESFTKAIESHDSEKDIQWWNAHYGSDTKTTWPTFEEIKD